MNKKLQPYILPLDQSNEARNKNKIKINILIKSMINKYENYDFLYYMLFFNVSNLIRFQTVYFKEGFNELHKIKSPYIISIPTLYIVFTELKEDYLKLIKLQKEILKTTEDYRNHYIKGEDILYFDKINEITQKTALIEFENVKQNTKERLLENVKQNTKERLLENVKQNEQNDYNQLNKEVNECFNFENKEVNEFINFDNCFSYKNDGAKQRGIKLSTEDLKDIYNRIKNKENYSSIAKRYNVNKMTIYNYNRHFFKET